MEGIQSKQYQNWKSKKGAMDTKRNTPLLLHPGPPSCLDPFEHDILEWFNQCRQYGKTVTIDMFCGIATDLVENFESKSSVAQRHLVYRFLKKHIIVF